MHIITDCLDSGLFDSVCMVTDKNNYERARQSVLGRKETIGRMRPCKKGYIWCVYNIFTHRTTVSNRCSFDLCCETGTTGMLVM